MLLRSALCVLAMLVSPIVSAQRSTSKTDQRLAELLERFPEADTNEDGTLTRAEVDAYRTKLQTDRRAKDRRQQQRVKPTHANVSYGEHERNVLDLYLPESASDQSPLPIFVYFHGGGFVAGDKSGFDAAPYLQRGYAVVSGNYRFVDGRSTLSPVPLRDAARAIQFLRLKASEWNLDADRIAVSGSSAGAVITLWIGYHDDLADPHSDDPVLKQSTRVQCLVPINGPTNLDPKWITKNMGGPKHIHGSFPKMFGASVSQSDAPDVRERILDSSPFEHASSDDPPTLLIYTGQNVGIPLPESASTGKLIHHAFFGAQLASKLKSLGVSHQFSPGVDPRNSGSKAILAWLDEHLRDGEITAVRGGE